MKNAILAGGVACLLASSAMAQVVNPGFEDGGGSLSGWTAFDNAFVDNTVSRNASGHSAKFFGNFSSPWNAAGVFQDFPATPGQTWAASAWFMTIAADPLVGTENFAVLNIEWHAADGSLISYITQRASDGTSAQDVWQQFSISGEAPAGTATARVVPLFLQPNFQGGSVFVDDVDFRLANAPCTADFNGDGVVDFFDYLDFVDAFSAGCN